jgi:hypothetical protein
VEAIYYEDDVPAVWAPFTTDNAEFFTEALPGMTEALGSPGGAAKMGALGTDTPLVAGWPRSDP